MAERNLLIFRLFGVFETVWNGVPLTHAWHSDRLLALLILRHPSPVERAWLAAVLWPDADPTNARFYLRRTLAALRQALGTQVYRLLAPTTHTLQFDLSDADCDLRAFDSALARNDEAGLEEAVGLYRGPLLEGWYEDWMLLGRGIREQRYLDALERLARAALERQEPQKAVPALRTLLALQPLRESAQNDLMRSLAAMGDYAAVTQTYRAFRLLLHQELRAEPAAETTALYHRLRAEAREQIQAAPSRSSPPLRLLPSPPTPFIGRETECEQVLVLLKTTRLLTLTGTGGVGKTRLAIAVAEKVAGEYAHGVCFVDLSVLQEPERVASTVASALQVREEPTRPLLQTLTNYLQAHSLLLVLDNCEHLTEACSVLAEEILGTCPQVRLFTTSRQPLSVSWERVWRVPSLTLPEGDEMEWTKEKEAQGILMASDAARLFVERATSTSPGFHLTRENLGRVAELCCLLDGIPLALELAAAWMRVMSLEQTINRLRERLDLLQTRRHGRPERHQTLRATLDWSYALLNGEEQRLLRRLSVFAGGWSLEAAEAVCAEAAAAPDSVLLTLAGLVDKSLVVYEEQGGVGRYHLLETTRQYAREKLHEAGETDLLGGRHRDYFVQALHGRLNRRDWEPIWDIDVPACTEAYHRWCAVERANCRAALQFSLNEPNGVQSAMHMAAQLRRYWHRHGYHTEARRWTHAALEKDEPPSFIHERLMALNSAAFFAHMQSDNAVLSRLADEAIVLAREYEPETIFHILHLVLDATQDWTQRLPIHAEQVALAREKGDPRLIALALISQSRNFFFTGKENQIRPWLEEALDCARRYDDDHLMMNVNMMLSALLWWEGDHLGSRRLGMEVVEYQRRAGNPFGLGYQCVGLAVADRRLGDFASMRAWYKEGIRSFQRIGHTWGIIKTLADIVGGVYESLPARTIADAEWAARVVGAGEQHGRLLGLNSADYPEARLEIYEPGLVPSLLRELGEEEFARLKVEGAAMTLEEAVEYALEA